MERERKRASERASERERERGREGGRESCRHLLAGLHERLEPATAAAAGRAVLVFPLLAARRARALLLPVALALLLLLLLLLFLLLLLRAQPQIRVIPSRNAARPEFGGTETLDAEGNRARRGPGGPGGWAWVWQGGQAAAEAPQGETERAAEHAGSPKARELPSRWINAAMTP
jgi:hypothetical protein